MSLIDIDDVKAELGLEVATYDTVLQLILDAIENLFEEMAMTKFGSTSITEYHSTPKYTRNIFLRVVPIISITSIHDDPDWEYGTVSLIAEADYTFDPDTGIVSYGADFFEGERNVKVVYTAGYTLETLPKRVKQIIIRQAATWYTQQKNKGWDVSSIGQPGGGTILRKNLEDNLLPEFKMLVELMKP